jgi:hypothetical protein
VLGLAAGAGTAAYGIQSAIKGFGGGGARGILGGVAGAEAAVGGVLAAIPGAGPVAEAFLGNSAVLGVVKQFLGDPKKKFDEKQNRALRDNRYFEPASLDVSAAESGGLVDKDYRGRTRFSNLDAYAFNRTPGHYDIREGILGGIFSDGVYTPIPSKATPIYRQTINVVMPVNAMDSKSIVDRRMDIASALQGALKDAHPIGVDIGQLASRGA